MSTYKNIFVSDEYDGYEAGTQIQSIDGSVKIFGESAFASLEDAVSAKVANAVIRVASGKYEGTDADGSIAFYVADSKGNVSAADQVVFVNFDGGTGLSYDNGAFSRAVDMEASTFSADEKAQIVDELNAQNADQGVVFTADAAVAAAVTHSTINVGSTDDFDDLGNFKGLSETVDTGNVIKTDEAFVNTKNITSVEDVIEVIDHEAGHLVGESHEVTTGTIEDFADAVTNVAQTTIAGVTTAYTTTRDAMSAAAASTTGEATVNFLTTAYASATTTSEVNFGTTGTYTLTGGKGAYLNFEVQLNDGKSDSVTPVMNITDAEISFGKVNLYTNSTMNIKDSIVNFDDFQSGSSWFGVKKNSELTIDNSTVGYKANSTIVSNFFGPTMRVYGTMTVKNNSTLYTSVGSSYSAAEALNISGNGTLTVTASSVYMTALNLGNEFISNYFYGDASASTSASVVLDNAKMYNSQYVGDNIGTRTDGIVIGDGSTHAGVLTLKNGSVVDLVGDGSSTYYLKNATVNSNGTINMDATSSIKLNSITNAGTITVDMTGATAAVYKLIDASATSDYGTYEFATGKDNGYTLTVNGNDLYATKADMTNLAVNADWSDQEYGAEVTVGGTTYYYGINAFNNLNDASSAVTEATTTITLDGATALSSAAAFGGGYDVTIKGSAAISWDNWFMVGRDASSGDVSKLAKVIFDGATITMAAGSSGDSGPNISGAEQDSSTKGYGEIDVINRSNVHTTWTVNKNVLNVNTGSVYTSQQLLNISGRPASETPSGEDYEAQLNIDNATVNAYGSSNASGLVIGNEGKGKVTLTNGATLNANKIEASEKSTISIDNSTVAVGGTFANPGAFTNNGTVNVTGTSKLSATSYTGNLTLGASGETATLTTDGFTQTSGTTNVFGDVTATGYKFNTVQIGFGTGSTASDSLTMNGGSAGLTYIGQDKVHDRTYTLNVTGDVSFSGLYHRGSGIVNIGTAETGATVTSEYTNVYGAMNITNSTFTQSGGATFCIVGRTDKEADGSAVVTLDNSTLINHESAAAGRVYVGTNDDDDGSGKLILKNNSSLQVYSLVLNEKVTGVTNDVKVTVDNSSITVDDYTYMGDKVGAITMGAGSELEIIVGANSAITTGTITNEGTITVDMSSATKAVYKLVDARSTSDYGTYEFATGKDNGYTLSVQDNDLVAYDATKIDMTTLVVDASWSTTKSYGDEITVGSKTYYYGFNAFSNFNDTVSAVTEDTTAINFAAGTYAAPYGATLKNSSGETLKISTTGAVISSDPVNCTGTVLKLGTGSDTVSFFNEATADKYELTAGSNLTVFQFNTEKYSNVLFSINGDMTTQGTYYTKAGTRTDIAKDASLTVDGSIRPSANGTGFYSYGTTNVYGTLTLNVNEINSDKRIKIGYSSYQNKDAQMNVDGGTVTVRGVASGAPSWEEFDDSNPAVTKIFGNYSKIEGDTAATLSVINGGIYDTTGAIENEGIVSITIDKADTRQSQIKVASFSGASGTINVDMTDADTTVEYVLIDDINGGTNTYGTISVTGTNWYTKVGTGDNDGDLIAYYAEPEIVIHEGGSVTYAGGSASAYGGGNYKGVYAAVDMADTVTAIKTDDVVTISGGSEGNPTMVGILASGAVKATSITDGIDLKTTGNGCVAAFSQYSSAGGTDLKGIGDIKVESTNSTSSTLGIRMNSGTDTDTCTLNIEAASLYVKSTGKAKAFQGSFAKRTSTITITGAVTAYGVGSAEARGFNMVAGSSLGKVTLNFGSLAITSESGNAWGVHDAGSADADLILNGNMTVTGGAYGIGFRLAGAADYDIKGKENKEIDITVSSTSNYSMGADVGNGDSSTAKLNLDVNNFTVTSTNAEAYGLYVEASTGAAITGSVNNLSVTGGTKAYAIYTAGGSVSGTFGTISATSTGSGSAYAIYATGGGTVTFNDAVTLTGDIYVGSSSSITTSLDTTGAAITYSGAWSNSGTLTVNMTGSETAEQYLLVENTSETAMTLADYGTVTISGNSHYKATVIGNDLYAVDSPVAQIGDVKYYSMEDAVAAVQDGETIEILVDSVELPSINNSGKSYTIKGLKNGENITQVTNAAWPGDHNTHKLTGITFEDLDFAGNFTEFTVGESASDTLTLKNCKFTGTGNAFDQGWGPGKVVLTNCVWEQGGTYGIHFESGTNLTLEATGCSIRGKVNGYAYNGATFTSCTFDGGAEDANGKYIAEIKLRANTTFNNCTFTQKFASGQTEATNQDDNGINIPEDYIYSFNNCSIKDSAVSVSTLVGEVKATSAAVIDGTKSGDVYTSGTFVTNGLTKLNELLADDITGMDGLTGRVKYTVSGDTKTLTADYWTNGETTSSASLSGTLTVPEGTTFAVADNVTVTSGTIIRLATIQGSDAYNTFVSSLETEQAANCTVQGWTCAIGDTKYYTLSDAVNSVTGGQTITLLCNISDTTAIATQTDVAFTIDLAGYNYENTATLTNNGEVTITDSTAPAEKNHFNVGSWTNAATTNVLTAESSVTFNSNDYVSGVGTVNINGDATIKKPATGGSDNGGLKADGGTLTVNVAENVDLYSNAIASGSDNAVVMTAHNATIHGTEYAEIFNAVSGGSIQINAEGAAQNLKIKSETNNNVGLRAYINADLKVYGLESLDVTRTAANKGVNAVYASSGSNVTINTAGDALNTTISVKGGQMDENSGSNAAAMALFSSWYTGSGEEKKFATLNAHGIKSVKAEASGLYGQAFAVYETYGSTLNVNSAANATATGEISAKAEYYSNAVVAAGGSVSIYGIKDINSLATGNEERSIKGTAIGVNVYGETQYSSPNDKAYLTINSVNAAHDTSISAKSTSDDDPSSSWDAYAMGVYSYKEAAVYLNGIKDITSEAKGVAYGLYSYSTTAGKVNDVDIDMAGKLSATTTNDGGESYGVYSLYYSDIDIEGNGTAEIKATSSGSDSYAYGVLALLGADVTLNNLAAITAEGTTAVSVYGSGADAKININGQSADSKTAITGDVYAEDGAAVNLKNVAVTGNVEEIQDSSTYGTVKFTGTNTVDGAVTLQGNKSFTAAADSFSLTETGTDAADVIAINGNLSVSGEGTSVAIAGTTTAKASITGTVTNSADSTLNLSNATVTKSLTNNGTATLENVNTTEGWTLAAGSVTYTNSLTNGTDLTAVAYTGTVNGDVYASSGTLDLRGVDLRLKGAPVLHGGTSENPETLDTLKATRVLFGDIYDGGGVQTITNIVLENCTVAPGNYRAALGVYYDELTVNTVSVNAAEGWYWDQQYQPVNYQMYTGFGGTLNINSSLTTGEYLNAGYSVGGTGITNLAAGATINCLDFQNTGNSASGTTAEQAAQNIANGVVHVNGADATLNAAALNNHAITTFGTVNLTSHPVHTTADGGLYSVNYGTGAKLTIGQLNFLNKQGDATKNQMRFGDNAVTTIGGLSTNPEVGADFYITETADTSINKDGGNAVQFTGDIVFTTYANADSAGAKFSLNLDSSDDYFTGAIRGTVSASNRWGKWGSAVMGDEDASNEHITGMMMSLSNGAVWNVTDDSFVNNLTITNASVNMTKDETISFSDTWSNSGTLTVDMTGATENVYKLVDYTGTGTVSSYGTVALDNNDGGYITTVIANDLYAIKSSAAVAKIGDNYYHTMSAALEDVKTNETITLLADLTADSTSFTVGKAYSFDLNGYSYTTSGNVTDTITFSDSTMKFAAADITNAASTISGSTKVEATGTFTNSGILNMDLASLVLANTWSGSSGTINVTGTLSESFYKIVDQTNTELTLADYGTLKYYGDELSEGYSFAVEYGDLVIKKDTAQEASGEVTETDISITNNQQEETYVSKTYETANKNVTVTADDKANEMKITGEITAQNTTINNAGDTVHVTRDVTSTETTAITTSGTETSSTVQIGGEVSGADVTITNTKGADTETTVSAANGFTATTGDATITNSGDGDLTVSGAIAAENGTATVSNTGDGELTVSEITAENVDIIHAGANTLNVTNSITATGEDASETEAAAKIQNITKDADLTIAANVYVRGGTLEIRNETQQKLDASGKLEVKDIRIYNNDWTKDSKLGNIDITDQIEAAGNIEITNSSEIEDKGTGTNKKGIVNLGTETHTAGGDLVINNTEENTINGSGAVETAEQETAAKFAVEGNATITNAGHVNAEVVAAGDVSITNTSVNTLIGDYTGANVTVENVGGAAHDVELTATDGNIVITNSTSAEEGSGVIDDLTATASNGYVSISGNGTTTNAVINSDTLYMGGTSVELTDGTILNEGSNIYIQYANEAAYPETPVDGAVLTITGEKTVGANIVADDLDGNLYGTVKMNGTQTYTGAVAGKNISIESGSDVTMNSLTFDFGTLAIAGKLNIDFDTLDSYTGAGNVEGTGTLNITNAGTWIVNDSVYRNFSAFAGTVTMTDSTSIVMGIGDAPTDTALTAAQSYMGDNSTMVVNGNSKVYLSGDGVTTGIKFTGNGTLYAGTYDDGELELSPAFTQTLTEDNSDFTGTANVGEGATLTLEGNFGGNVNLNYNSATAAATTLQLNATGVEVAGAITGDSNDIIDVDENATLSAGSALNAFSGEVAVASEKALTLSNSNTTAAKFTGAGEIIANTADHAQKLTAAGALDGFSGTVTLGADTLTLSGANTTAAKFTGTDTIEADAKQTLTVEGALNGFSGTVELEGNEIELDAVNSTAAKFTGTTDAVIDADAKQTLTAEGALNDFSGTVELEDNEIELDAVNSTAAKFTGTVDSKINADAKQTLTAEGALNDFSGTVELEGNEIELDAINTTAAKFTGTTDAKINADAKQTLTVEGALNGFSGTVELEGNEIELDAANSTAAKFTGTNLITAKANQTFSGDLSGFEGTIDANGENTVVTLSGTVADTLNLKGNEVVLDDAVAHTGAINVNANTELTTLTTNDNAVDVKSGTITNVTADEGAVTVSGGTATNVTTDEGVVTVTEGTVVNVTTTSGNIDLTGYTAGTLTSLQTTSGKIKLNSDKPITVSGTLDGDMDYTVANDEFTAAGMHYTGESALSYTDAITVTAAANYFDNGYTLIDTDNGLTLASDYSISLTVGSASGTVKVGQAVQIGGTYYQLSLVDSKDLVLTALGTAANTVYVNENWTADPYAEVFDTYYNPAQSVKRNVGYDAAKNINDAVSYIAGDDDGKGTIELTENKTYAVSTALGTTDNGVTNMTLQSRSNNPTATYNAKVTGDINAGTATTLNLSHLTATGSVYGAGTVNITGTKINRFSGTYIAAGGNLNITGGTYTSRYIAGGKLNAAAAAATSVTITGTDDRTSISGSIYGGNIVTSGSVTQTAAASVTVNTADDKKVYIAGNIYAAGLRRGGSLTVSGDRTVTFTGDGDNLSFTGRVSGGAQGTATVTGTADLAFTNFAGKFNGSISDFNTMTLSGNTALSLGRRQTLTKNTNLTFSVTSTTSSAADTAMYTVRDKNAWEFSKSITVTADSSTQSGTYTLVGNYAAGFEGFTFTVANQSYTLGTVTTDNEGNTYVVTAAGDKLQLTFGNHLDSVVITDPTVTSAQDKETVIYATDKNGAELTQAESVEKITATAGATVVFNDDDKKDLLDDNAAGVLLYKEDSTNDIKWVGNGDTANVSGGLSGNSIDISGKTVNIDTATLTTVTANDDAAIILGGASASESTIGTVTVAEGKTLTINVGDNATVNGNTISGTNGTVVIENTGTLTANVVNDVVVISNSSFNSLYGTYGGDNTTSVAVANTGKVKDATFNGTTVTLNDAVNAGALGYYNDVTVNADTLNLNLSLANWAGTLAGSSAYSFANGEAVTNYSITIDGTTSFGTTAALNILSGANYANTTFTVNGETKKLGDTFTVGTVEYALTDLQGSVYLLHGEVPQKDMSTILVDTAYASEPLFSKVTYGGKDYYVGINAFGTLDSAAAAATSDTQKFIVNSDVTGTAMSWPMGRSVTTDNANGVTITDSDPDNWNYINNGTIGAGVDLKSEYISATVGTVQIDGIADASGQFYQGYDTVVNVSSTGEVYSRGDELVVRKNTTADKGIFITGSDNTKLQLSASWTQFYSGTISLKNTKADFGSKMQIRLVSDGSGYAAPVLTMDNSNVSVCALRMLNTATSSLDCNGTVNVLNGSTFTMKSGELQGQTQIDATNTLNVEDSTWISQYGFTSAGTINIEDSTATITGTLTNNGAVTMDADSTITVNAFSGTNGTITVDMTGATGLSYKLVDASAASDYGTYQFAEGKDNGYTLSVVDNDLVATKAADLVVNTAWSGMTAGEKVTVSGKEYTYGTDAFSSGVDAANSELAAAGSTVLFNGGNTDAYNKDGDVKFTNGVTIGTTNGVANFQALGKTLLFGSQTVSTTSTIDTDSKIKAHSLTVEKTTTDTTSSLTIKKGSAITLESADTAETKTQDYKANLWVKKNAHLTVEEGATITLGGSIENKGTIDLAGTINVSNFWKGDGGLYIAGSSDAGTLNVNGGSLTYTAQLSEDANNSVVYVGKAGVAGSELNITNGGSVTLNDKAWLQVNAGSTVNLNGGTLTAVSATTQGAANIVNNGTVNVSGTSKISATTYTGSMNVGKVGTATTLTTDGIKQTQASGNDIKITDGSTVTMSGNGFDLYYIEDSNGIYNDVAHTGYTLNIQDADSFKVYALYANGGSTATVSNVTAIDATYLNAYGGTINLNGGTTTNESIYVTGSFNATGATLNDLCWFDVFAGRTGKKGGAVTLTNTNATFASVANMDLRMTVGELTKSDDKYYVDGVDQTATLNLVNSTVDLKDNRFANAGVVTMDADSSITAKTVTNSGTVSGSGKFNGTDAADTFTNNKAASMTAAVDMKAGDDTLALNVDSILAGAVDLGEGADIVNVTGITSLTTDIAGAKKVAGQISNAETFQVDNVDMVLGEAKQIAGTDTANDVSDDVWAKLSTDSDNSLIVSWGRTENDLTAAVTALDEQKAEMTIGQAVTATIENPTKDDFTKKNNGTLA